METPEEFANRVERELKPNDNELRQIARAELGENQAGFVLMSAYLAESAIYAAETLRVAEIAFEKLKRIGKTPPTT